MDGRSCRRFRHCWRSRGGERGVRGDGRRGGRGGFVREGGEREGALRRFDIILYTAAHRLVCHFNYNPLEYTLNGFVARW